MRMRSVLLACGLLNLLTCVSPLLAQNHKPLSFDEFVETYNKFAAIEPLDEARRKVFINEVIHRLGIGFAPTKSVLMALDAKGVNDKTILKSLAIELRRSGPLGIYVVAADKVQFANQICLCIDHHKKTNAVYKALFPGGSDRPPYAITPAQWDTKPGYAFCLHVQQTTNGNGDIGWAGQIRFRPKQSKSSVRLDDKMVSNDPDMIAKWYLKYILDACKQ
ncbi:hypothetical protein Mal15_46110 [Stieleria maiorica]|uniref:DUF4136 domain-containing protein n=1 Tax=Stieleria maiorica TaxID=2795974 RepID=A0A5B9MKJ2_9BACT|nr:hypothetical protein [Stieleria maiorica]QEG00541.1 hypothetical protein Mal15_46110 [Stieleria maiorica]